MRTLPNGVKIFNSTPHSITFWHDDWNDIVSVESDTIINAKPVSKIVQEKNGVQLITTIFEAQEDGRRLIKEIKTNHPDTLIVGSIIAAQAYPGDVVSMVPHPDYMRVPPAEKRMLPDKFNVFIAE